jgi:hypothetical protein
MPRALTANIRVSVDAQYSDSLDLASQLSPLLYNAQALLTTGSGANQGNLVFSDARTLAASANEDLDLNGAALTDAFGAGVAFTKVRALIIKASPNNVNNVVVGGAATNGFIAPFGAAAHTVNVRPGGVLCLIAPDATGYAVTPATADLLRIANSGAGSAVDYEIIIIGS